MKEDQQDESANNSNAPDIGQQRQEFLLRLSDALRAETGVEAVGRKACEMIAAHLEADRVYLVTLNPHNDEVVITHEVKRQDMPALKGVYYSSDFPSAIQEIFERTIVYDDVRTDSRLSDIERQSFAGLGAVGFIAASIRHGKERMIWAAGALTTTPRSWLSFEIRLFEDAIERAWAAVERARAENELAQSEAKYRTLFNAIDEAVAWCEIITDAQGKAIDYRLMELNPAFEKITGLSIEGTKGKRAKEVVPGLEDFWIEKYGAVALDRMTVRFENKAAGLGRWFNVFAAPVGPGNSGQFVVVYTDITEKKQREETQAFLLKLSDALGPLADPVEIQQAVASITMDHFSVDRCYYCLIQGDSTIIKRDAAVNGLPSVAGTYSLTDIPILQSVIAAGAPFTVSDVRTTDLVDESLRDLCIQLQVISFIDVPVVKNGAPVGILCIVNSIPRNWIPFEVQLAQEVAERMWVAIERAEAEEALRESELNLASLFSAIPIGVALMNTSGKAIFLNKEMERFLPGGLMPSVDKDRTWRWKGFYPDGRTIEVSNFPGQRAIRGETGGPFEFLYTPDDGDELWTRVNFYPIKDASGTVVRFVCIITDVDDLKRTAEALKESRERLQVTMESAVDFAIITFDPDGLITSWSRGAELIFGFTEQQVLGEPIAAFYTKEDQQAGLPAQEMAMALATGRAPHDRWHVLPDGKRLFISGALSPVRIHGKLVGFVKVAQDLTRARELEQQREDFIGIASHELKTPVTSIKVYAEALQEQFEEEGITEKAELMHKLDAQIDRLTKLIRDLLDTTKITEGELLLSFTQFDLDDLLRERLEELQRISRVHRLEYAGGAETWITGDRERIGQVITNIVSNAIKYSPAGSPVSIAMSKAVAGVNISITDNGMGIPAGVKDQIFDRFFRVSTEQMQNYPGMGLGLFISKEIIRRHGGTITVDSEEGKGSTFHFFIPYDMAHE